MRRAPATCAAVLLIVTAAVAQTYPSDLSGRWQLVEPTAAERRLDTLAITSPDQLLIRQTPRAISVEHPSKQGMHPEAGSFGFGSRGTIGGLPGGSETIDKTSVSQIGTQLVISRSVTRVPEAGGVRITVARGSMWRLEGQNRLVIEFSEERTGERPRVAVRSYVRAAPQ